MAEKWRLMMAPHKCSFIIFSNDKTTSGDIKINIKLFGKPIDKCVDPTKLSIRFDKHFSFKSQISYLRDSCLKRMNIENPDDFIE